MYSTSPIPSSDQVKYLELVFYLLLVNKEDFFPRLTCKSSEHRLSCHALPPNTPQVQPQESDLNLKVREYRRKMGFGSLSTPSEGSEIVLDQSKVDQHIRGVQAHLEAMIQSGLHHMRKNELWKRMLYGVSTSPDTKSVSSVGCGVCNSGCD